MYDRAKFVLLGFLLVCSNTRTFAMYDFTELVTEDPRHGYDELYANPIPEEIYEYLESISNKETVKDLVLSPTGKKHCDYADFKRWQLKHLKIYQPGAPIHNGRSTFLMFEHCGAEEICFKILRLSEIQGKMESESWIYYEDSFCTGPWSLFLECVIAITGTIAFVSQLCYSFLVIKTFCKWILYVNC